MSAGRLKKLKNFNGTVTDYTYDDANRLVTLEEKTALVGGDVIADYHYTLDANGNRIQEVQNEPQALPATASATDVYAYNPERNRLTQAGATTFAYDYEGQLNDKSGAAYAFDYEHRLVKKETTGANAATHRFYYDGAGRRLKADYVYYGPPPSQFHLQKHLRLRREPPRRGRRRCIHPLNLQFTLAKKF